MSSMDAVTAGILMTIRQTGVTTIGEGVIVPNALNNLPEGESGEASSDDEGVLKYIVELKLPKGQKLKSNNWLRGGNDHTAQLFPNYDANGVKGEELSAPREPLKDLVGSEKDACTGANWRTAYFSYQRQTSGDGPFVSSTSDEFDDDKSIKGKQPFNLAKSSKAVTTLTISSPYIREHLLRATGIEFYSAVTLGASDVVLTWPFSPLYHHLAEIRSTILNDQNATKTEQNNIDALNFYVTKGAPAKLYEDVRSKITQGFITYEEIWALFKPGDFAVVKDPLRNDDISQITSVKLERNPRGGSIHGPQFCWYITLLKITWNGDRFRRVSTNSRMELFTGSRKISDLQVCPLWSREDRNSLIDAAIKHGKLWKKLCEAEPTTMMYEGQALCVLTEEATVEREGELDFEYNTFNLSSVVVMDPNARSKAVMQGAIDSMRHLQHPTFGIGNTTTSRVESEFSDEEYTICPASIIVFSLDNQEWCSVNVANLKPKEWKPATFDRLVLDHEKKDTLTRLAKTNSRRIQSKKSVDIIEGKGRGIVLLLHGPPGVGKTLTAEVLSEFTKRPLLKVNLGRVASHSKWEQALEQIFINAEDWKAILLIDEAEIVLEKRTFERMIHNSWISVFLRKLEYYKGILILTTNLIDCIDEAFESRISYAVRFRDLSHNDRRQIWTDFIKEMKIFPAYKDTLLSEVDRWSEAEINGRQIRNIILMAENLAASDEEHPRLTPMHVDKLMNATLEFCDYNRGNVARAGKIQLTGPSY